MTLTQSLSLKMPNNLTVKQSNCLTVSLKTVSAEVYLTRRARTAASVQHWLWLVHLTGDNRSMKTIVKVRKKAGSTGCWIGLKGQGHHQLSREISHYIWFGLNEGHNDEDLERPSMCYNLPLVEWLLGQWGILKHFPHSRCIFISHWLQPCLSDYHLRWRDFS